MRWPLRILLCLLPLPALAGQALAPASRGQCEAAITAATSTGDLPPGLLSAIAKIESGRPDPRTGRLHPWPWTINAEGQGQFFASKAQAVSAVKALQARGVQSIDVGCLQVNLMYHPHAFSSLEQAFDPDANAAYAKRFLTRLYDSSHDWAQAIAAYHSSTADIGADYRRRVLAVWHNPSMAGWGLGLAVAYRAFLPEQRIYGDFAGSSRAYGAFAPTVASLQP